MSETDRHMLVFIGHSFKDQAVARELYRFLKTNRWLNLWFIDSSLKPSQNWDQEIRSAVTKADVLVLLFSRESSRREEYIYPGPKLVEDIYRINPRKGILILPLRLDRAGIPTGFTLEGWLDYFPKARRTTVNLELMERLKNHARQNGFSTESIVVNPDPEQGFVWSPTHWKDAGLTPDEGVDEEESSEPKPMRWPSKWKARISSGLTRTLYISLTVLVLLGLAAVGLAVNFVNTGQTVNAVAQPIISGVLTLTPLPTPTLGEESVYVPPVVDRMRMVYIPKGEFIMGGDAYFEERPIRSVMLDAFWIDQTEVTNGMFAWFLNEWGNRQEGGVPLLDDEDEDARIHFIGGIWRADPRYEDHPVVEVTWYGANAYCAWAGQRLPTEAEWEKAARGEDGYTYPWGNREPTAELLNFNHLVGDTTMVGSYPEGASPYSALDMAGNVWEWVADKYSRTYYSSSPLENPLGPDTGFFRVLRSGGWNSRDTFVRSMHRNRGSPTISHDFVGFRCALSE